jgi:hypothetical protein
MQAFPEFDTEYYSQMRGAWQDIDGKLFMTNDQLEPFEVSETEFLAMLTKWVDNRNFDIVCKIISHNRSGILRSEQVNDFLAFITEPRYNGDTLGRVYNSSPTPTCRGLSAASRRSKSTTNIFI